MPSDVRTAIFSVMRAAVPEEFGETAPPQVHVAQGAMPYLLDGSSHLPEGYWDQAVPSGHGTLPHDPSMCLLWCAVALGALVRGCPLENVGRLLAASIGTVRQGGGWPDYTRCVGGIPFFMPRT